MAKQQREVTDILYSIAKKYNEEHGTEEMIHEQRLWKNLIGKVLRVPKLKLKGKIKFFLMLEYPNISIYFGDNKAVHLKETITKQTTYVNNGFLHAEIDIEKTCNPINCVIEIPYLARQ